MSPTGATMASNSGGVRDRRPVKKLIDRFYFTWV